MRGRSLCCRVRGCGDPSRPYPGPSVPRTIPVLMPSRPCSLPLLSSPFPTLSLIPFPIPVPSSPWVTRGSRPYPRPHPCLGPSSRLPCPTRSHPRCCPHSHSCPTPVPTLSTSLPIPIPIPLLSLSLSLSLFSTHPCPFPFLPCTHFYPVSTLGCPSPLSPSPSYPGPTLVLIPVSVPYHSLLSLIQTSVPVPLPISVPTLFIPSSPSLSPPSLPFLVPSCPAPFPSHPHLSLPLCPFPYHRPIPIPVPIFISIPSPPHSDQRSPCFCCAESPQSSPPVPQAQPCAPPPLLLCILPHPYISYPRYNATLLVHQQPLLLLSNWCYCYIATIVTIT